MLIDVAHRCRASIHSLAFFLSSGDIIAPAPSRFKSFIRAGRRRVAFATEIFAVSRVARVVEELGSSDLVGGSGGIFNMQRSKFLIVLHRVDEISTTKYLLPDYALGLVVRKPTFFLFFLVQFWANSAEVLSDLKLYLVTVDMGCDFKSFSCLFVIRPRHISFPGGRKAGLRKR